MKYCAMAATATATKLQGHVCYPATMVCMHYRCDDIALKIGRNRGHNKATVMCGDMSMRTNMRIFA